MAHALIELDGSLGEGGGQILRTSLTLSLITGKPFHLFNIRAGRSKPGLQPQHLMCVRAAATVSQAQTRGASLNSSDLVFEPGSVQAGNHHFDIGTAGATSLVLHTLYLPLALRCEAASALTLIGGTHVLASPSFHFLETTWLRYMELVGLKMRLRMHRPGFYPRGGGRVECHIEPCNRLRSLQLRERGPVKRVTGFSAVAGLPEAIAQRQARRATQRLKQHGIRAEIDEQVWEGGPGTVLALMVDTSPVPALFCGLGARGKPAERVADEAVDQVIDYLDADPVAVDAHSADQLLLPLALADGSSEYSVAEITSHLLTNAAVIGSFLERDITCDGKPGRPGVVRIGA